MSLLVAMFVGGNKEGDKSLCLTELSDQFLNWSPLGLLCIQYPTSWLSGWMSNPLVISGNNRTLIVIHSKLALTNSLEFFIGEREIQASRRELWSTFLSLCRGDKGLYKHTASVRVWGRGLRSRLRNPVNLIKRSALPKTVTVARAVTSAQPWAWLL